MSEFNFDNMKNVDIPESWVDGALNVPKDLKTPFPFLKYSKIIAFAASIVLVCCLSVALFLVTNSKQAVPPVKNDETNFISQVHKSTDNAESTESVTENKPQSDSTASTQPETQSQKENETAQPTDKDEEPTDSSESKPVEKPEKPEKPKPTENTVKPTKPIPTENATEPVLEVPPDGPFVEPDTELSYVDSYSSGKIIAKVHKDELRDSIYCRVYDSNGNLVGDNNLYSNSKRAGIVMGIEDIESGNNDFNTVEYKTEKLGTYLSSGKYYVVFYDNLGANICSGYINIS